MVFAGVTLKSGEICNLQIENGSIKIYAEKLKTRIRITKAVKQFADEMKVSVRRCGFSYKFKDDNEIFEKKLITFFQNLS